MDDIGYLNEKRQATLILLFTILAMLIACPFAFYAIIRWLQHFAYKTHMSWWVFMLAGVKAIVVSILTVSWQTIKAARRNPVDALHYE